MTAEADDVLTLTAAVPDSRIAAANRFKALVRQYGPDCHRTAGTFGFQLRQDLAKFPEEANALSEALKLRATDELVRLRGTADPKTYLPTLSEALANQTGLPRDLTSWALFTWHDALDVAPKGPTQVEFTREMGAKRLWVKRKPPSAKTALATGLVVGLVSFLAGGAAECISLRISGPTFLEEMIVKNFFLLPHENHTSHANPQTSWEGLKEYGAIGFALNGTASFLGGFCGWSLAGGTRNRLMKGCLFAAGMSAVGSVVVVVSTCVPPIRVMLSTPGLGQVAHLGIQLTMVFGVSYRVAVNDRSEDDALDMVALGLVGIVSQENDFDLLEGFE